MSDLGPEWHARRATVVGASEVAALFECQPDYAMSLYALWHVKTGRVPPPPVAGERVAWGIRLEQVIAEGAAEQEGWTIAKGGWIADRIQPGMGATLDYLIEDGDAAGPGVLEIKNVDWLVHRRTWTDGEPPPHILLQLQQQLACSGRTWGAVVGLVGGNELRVYRYDARPKTIAAIRAKIAAFWQSIAENKPPPVDGSASATHVLRELFPDAIDDEVDMTGHNELPEACAAFECARRARSEANDAYDEARNRLQAIIGGHKRAVTTGWRVTQSITPEKPPRPPNVGEMIPGRAEIRRLTVREQG